MHARVLSLILTLLVSSFFIPVSAQIYQPEGLNIPGEWNGWTNPPAAGPFLSSSQAGGLVNLITTGERRWTTTFQSDYTGSRQFLFTSGPSSNAYSNKWGGTAISLNSIQNVFYQSASNNSVSLVNGRFYTINWSDIGYQNTSACVMETSATPVTVSSVAQSPVANSVYPGNNVLVTASLSASPSSEEKFYVRYTLNGWTTSSVVLMTVSGNSASASIPGQVAGTLVSYYVISSTLTLTSGQSNLTYDLATIRRSSYSNGQNESFTVQNCPNPTFTTAPSSTSCFGESLLYQTQSGMSNYSWSFSGTLGTDYTISSGGTSGSSSASIVWLTQGSKTVSVNYLNTLGCTSSNAASNTVSIQAIDFANIQFPQSASICQGSTADFYGQLYEPGLTNVAAQAGGPNGVIVQFGISSSNTNPATWPVGSWQSTQFNFDGSGGNNDEFTITTGSSLSPGTYYYAFRYSLNGCGYQYGGWSGSNGGFWNGSSNVNGVFTVNPTVTPTVTISASPDLQVCPFAGPGGYDENWIFFTASTTNCGDNPTYQWYVNGIDTWGNEPNVSGDVFIGGEQIYVTVIPTNDCQTSNLVTSNILVPVAMNAQSYYVDYDGDGYGNSFNSQMACSPQPGLTTVGGDCDDYNANVYPGATEICGNGADDDCIGGDLACNVPGCTDNTACNYNSAATNDDGSCSYGSSFYADTDNDGYGAGTTTQACTQPTGFVTNNTDCNDSSNAVYPGATETCNNIDDDCDGSIDEGLIIGDPSVFPLNTWNLYAYGNANAGLTDYNGFVSLGNALLINTPSYFNLFDTPSDISGYQGCPVPVDDHGYVMKRHGFPAGYYDFIIHNFAGEYVYVGNETEWANSLCCGWTSPNQLYTGMYLDENSYFQILVLSSAFQGPSGIMFEFVPSSGCTNTLACNFDPTASVDDGSCVLPETYFADADGDGFGELATSTDACTAPTGYVSNSTDCDDSDNAVYPGATETCNDIDDDCDGTADDGLPTTTYYLDGDGDGFGTTTSADFCEDPGVGYATNNTDCNDTNAQINPTATELCNGIDDNCNNQIDEGLPFTDYYVDSDGDGYGAGTAASFCANPGASYATTNTDCNNGDANIYPGATETCNGVDDDCDGSADEGVLNTYYADADGDGYGNSGNTQTACSQPTGYVTVGGDCFDGSAAINPGATEICNNIDDNCDGTIDNAFVNYYADSDGDGFGGGNAVSIQSCTTPAGYTTSATDCNNGNANVYPGAIEICNGIDDDCDSNIDEGVLMTYYLDSDGDGFGGATSTTGCSAPNGYVSSSTDCNDTNSAVNPGATEVCNSIDDDCDGTTDEGCPSTTPGEEPSNAVSAPSSYYSYCSNFYGTLAGALPSTYAQSTCVTGEDKWYTFTALSSGVTIFIGSYFNDILIELQDVNGNLIETENAVNGIGTEVMNYVGLTAGQVYRVGVRNYNSNLAAGNQFSGCIRHLKRGGCDSGTVGGGNWPSQISMCSVFKATYAGSGVQYRYTWTGLTGGATGNVYTRTQSSDYLSLTNVTPTLQSGCQYSVLVTNLYTIANGAGVNEVLEVPALAPCTITILADATVQLRSTDQCSNGPRFRSSVVASLPWVCGVNNWRWRFTEVNPSTYQVIGLPIEINRGAASNYLNLGTVAALQYGKTYAVQTAPVFTYTGSNYQWGPVQYLCIIGQSGMILNNDSNSQAEENRNDFGIAQDFDMALYPNPTNGDELNITLSGVSGDDQALVRIMNTFGQIVYEGKWNSEGVIQKQINVSRWSNGMYLFEVRSGEQTLTKRFMISQ